MKNYRLTKEEEEILRDFDEGKLVSVADFPKQKKLYEQYAKNFLKKNRNINLRISERDLSKLKTRAIEEGMPYQTLAASVLHKFANQ